MSRRILMATVAILALTAPAAAEDQAKPDETAIPKLEEAQKTPEKQPAQPAAGETAAPEQPGTTA